MFIPGVDRLLYKIFTKSVIETCSTLLAKQSKWKWVEMKMGRNGNGVRNNKKVSISQSCTLHHNLVMQSNQEKNKLLLHLEP